MHTAQVLLSFSFEIIRGSNIGLNPICVLSGSLVPIDMHESIVKMFSTVKSLEVISEVFRRLIRALKPKNPCRPMFYLQAQKIS